MSLLTEAKGRFAETIVHTLLECAGYRVLRLGVEETISEVKAGIARGEGQLKLPEQLQSAPDFLVVDPRSGRCTLLEVKFRRNFDERVATELHARLTYQLRYWPETVTAVVCADPPEPRPNADFREHIRCMRPGDIGRLIDPEATGKRWACLRMLGGVFDALPDQLELYRQSEQLIAPIRAWQ